MYPAIGLVIFGLMCVTVSVMLLAMGIVYGIFITLRELGQYLIP